VALLDHLGWHDPVRVAGHSSGVGSPRPWCSTTPTGPVRRADGQRQQAHGLGGRHHHGRAGPGPLDYDLPPLFYATQTLRYLPIADIQNDEVVSTWLTFIGRPAGMAEPGRLGQYEAALAWSTDPARTTRWPEIAVPCLVLAFEHDVDSPPR
jgi:pimeloyl-ACP methyl ester carboxylesterase